ncbi:Blp family class II bacteriocin [Clostridium cellulovorans]|uniref:Bacteriocin class II with double-glycine leader peptide n=1 Tax=Clostridium cellulovorans (strain ATCC 35296 / DSM 3052 / OCM 3 / 743B) TaxID=573061 RepID=D9SSI4_CLOC7|nr:Blp family class II bacteriocin [Clostridium cellulovorans]ADL50581.1 hypothetical protein Clocel_0811 [Clostridium cellulovorans 743B]
MNLLVNENFTDLRIDEIEFINGGMSDWDWVWCGVVTAGCTVIGAAIGTAVCPGIGTIGGANAGSVLGGIFCGALGAGVYIAIDHA